MTVTPLQHPLAGFTLDTGSREALKWAAAILMVLRWAGLTFFLSAWWLFSACSPAALAVFLGASLALVHENDSWASVAALPVLVAASRGLPRVRRRPWFFYAFYPAHLAALWLARTWLVPSG